ncbi:hypothetical protein BJ322DRAFT_998373 [Thelephora terrestris]|uniref:Arrestin C-terminal-like domain-containing protein n=1 Tax=Thelephora terrestris TaxID=56493 RepID=A0A9P6HTG1_9AGAM|nr:hypothetical protein BJ322DRAFT_998373 [Thelephora terrestris]
MPPRDKEKWQPTLEIVVTNDVLCLQGPGVDVEPVLLSGNVVLYLPDDTDIKEITLQFRGKAKLPPSSDLLSLTTSGPTYLICEHDSTFLEGKKTHSHTLKAGRHSFPFQLHIGGHLPSSISTTTLGGAKISYKLRAMVHRPGLIHNLHALLPITIIRSFTPDSLEYQQSSEIENTWPGKLMYSILLPHKAWAAGDTLTAVAKFVPISKGVKVLSITSTISETIRFSLNSHHRVFPLESTRPIAVTKHEVIGGKLVCGSECHHSNRVPPLYHPEDSSGQVSPVSMRDAGQESPAESSMQAGSNADDEAEASDEQSNDLVARLDITLPSFLTPTHHVEPITVVHRIRWSILIANLDGHTSELRCSLSIHVLDNHVLSEARSASTPTRRMLLGIHGGPEESLEDTQLPSYNAHIRDRVPTTGQSYSVSSETRTPSSALQPPSLQAHSDMHLPQVPADAPLDWITSALSRHQLSGNRRRSEDWSAPRSRLSSRLPSRASSPERGPRNSGHTTPANSHESRGIFRNPFSAIASSFSHSHRTHSHQSITSLGQPHTLESTEVPCRTSEGTTARNSPPSSPHISTGSMPCHLNEVPNYETASRGFAGGGVPPLTSMSGLPSYEEASTQSSTPELTTPPSPDV